MKNIRTAFIFDPCSALTLEDDVESAITEMDAMADLIGDQHLPIQVAYKSEAIGLDFSKKHFDLVVIDYGGLSAMGSYATGTVQVDAACQYAQDHPGCLFVIWTGYTVNIYRDELEEEFGHLDNILCRYEDSSHVYGNIDGDPKAIQKFRTWFAEAIAQAKAQDAGVKPKLTKPGRKKAA